MITPLHTAKTAKEVKALLEKGADINAQDNDGHTPLHWAVILEKDEVRDALCLAGADVTIKNNESKIPFDYIGFKVQDLVCPVCWIPDGDSHKFCGDYDVHEDCLYCGRRTFGSDYASSKLCSKTCLKLSMNYEFS